MSSSDDEFIQSAVASPAARLQTGTRGGRRSRQSSAGKHSSTLGLYRLAEKRAMLEYIVENEKYYCTRGNMLWGDMERARVCPSRSSQSMKEHFRKKLVKEIPTFPFLSAEQKGLFKKYRNYDFRTKGIPLEFSGDGERAALRAQPRRSQTVRDSTSSTEEETTPVRRPSRDNVARRPVPSVDRTVPPASADEERPASSVARATKTDSATRPVSLASARSRGIERFFQESTSHRSTASHQTIELSDEEDTLRLNEPVTCRDDVTEVGSSSVEPAADVMSVEDILDKRAAFRLAEEALTDKLNALESQCNLPGKSTEATKRPSERTSTWNKTLTTSQISEISENRPERPRELLGISTERSEKFKKSSPLMSKESSTKSTEIAPRKSKELSTKPTSVESRAMLQTNSPETNTTFTELQEPVLPLAVDSRSATERWKNAGPPAKPQRGGSAVDQVAATRTCSTQTEPPTQAAVATAVLSSPAIRVRSVDELNTR